MKVNELAKAVANTLINTGVEGGFDSVSCSTAGDYPSLGCQQVEGGRADSLLSYIDGGDYFIGRTYSDIVSSGELEDLSELISSEQGQAAQMMVLANDCEDYVQTILDYVPSMTEARSVIYSAAWMPTSTYVVRKFLHNRVGQIDYNNLYDLAEMFAEEYAIAADCEEYGQGYANRAWTTYDYVKDLDLEQFEDGE